MIKIKYDKYLEFAKKMEQTHFLHSQEWADFRVKVGWNYEIMGCYENENLIAAMIISNKKIPIPIINRKMYYISRGIIIDYKNEEHIKKVTKELKQFLKKNNGVFLRIDPGEIFQKIDNEGNPIANGKNNQIIIDNLEAAGFHHLGFTRGFEGMQPRYTFRVNLEGQTAKSILDNMDSKTRYNIKIGPKRGVKIVQSENIDIDRFYALMEDTSKRDDFIVRSKEYFELLKSETSYNKSFIKQYFAELDLNDYIELIEKELLSNKEESISLNNKINDLDKDSKKYKKNIKRIEELEIIRTKNKEKLKEVEVLKIEYPNKLTLATAMCIVHDNKCWHLFGASSQQFIQFRAVYQLINQMLIDSINEGYEFFDHFGTPGENNKDNHNYGLYYFKKGFGGEMIEFVGEFDLINNKLLYKLFNNIIQKAQTSKQNIVLKILLKIINIFK